MLFYSISYWDLMILVPNVLFLLFLVFKIRRICHKVGRNESPIFSVCVILVCYCLRDDCVCVSLFISHRFLTTLCYHGPC